jgi:hypothetical protein
MLVILGTAPLYGAAKLSVSGWVRDSSGVPQMGAEVQLLRGNLSVAATVYTNGKGEFSIPYVLPGRYSLKAMGAYFLPSLRENLDLRKSIVVNLTLNTLYEAMQWLPASPRSANANPDDWAWTLRSAANRPLLRWLEDGPLLVVSDPEGNTRKLKARLMASGQDGTFGESGERFSTTVEMTPTNSRELLARVDFEPDSDAGMESMLGFRQDLGYAGSVESVAAIAIHPEEMDGAGDQGVDEAAINTSETMHLGDEFEIDAGSAEVVGRIGGSRPAAVSTALPFATLKWRDGANTVQYRMATMAPNPGMNEDSATGTSLPAVAMRQGILELQRGMHQEVGFERQTDMSDMAVMVYADRIDDPILEAMTRTAGSEPVSGEVAGAALVDTGSGLMRTVGPPFSTTGVSASYEREIARGNRIAVSYTSGSALVMPAIPNAVGVAQVAAATRAHRTQAYTVSFSGILEGTHTRWRASYRWQPEKTITAVAPYMVNASDPYLNLHLRQPIHLSKDGSGGLEALFDARNLLAQGYRPYVLSDGSLLIFAQDQRAIRGGLAFVF